MAWVAFQGMGGCLGKNETANVLQPAPNEPVATRSALSMNTVIPVIESDTIVKKDGKVVKSNQESDLSLTKTQPSNLDTDLTPTVVRTVGYELNELIGEGSFSKVYVASHKLPNGKVKKVAVKVIRYDQVPEGWKRNKLMDELQIGKHVKHRNIINVEKVIKTSRRAFIFMELGQANLADVLSVKYRKGFPEDMTRIFYSQLIHAINYLHSVGIAHRDLKTDNLLLDASNNVKITDFGFAFSSTSEKGAFISKTSCGSRGYMAPEVFRPPYDPRPADVWSTGVILFEMLTNSMPFGVPSADKATVRAYLKQCQGPVKFPATHLNKLSVSVKDLVKMLLIPRPKMRISAANACQHEWLKIQTAVKFPSNFTSIKCNENQ